MVSKRISELPAAGSLDGSEQIPLTQDGETRRISSDTYQKRFWDQIARNGTALADVQKTLDDAAAGGRGVVVDSNVSVAGTLDVPDDLHMQWIGGQITQTSDLTPTLRCDATGGQRFVNPLMNGVGTDYDNTSASKAATAILLRGSVNVRVTGGRLRDFAGSGLRCFNDANGNACEDVAMDGTTVIGPASITAEGNFCGGAWLDDAVIDFSLLNCNIRGTAQGIFATQGCDGLTVHNNRIRDIAGQHGFYINAATGISITDNVIVNPHWLGGKIQISDTTTVSTFGATIANNTIINPGVHGIQLAYIPSTDGGLRHHDVTVAGNTVRGCANEGIRAQMCVGLLIEGNNVHDTRDGIFLEDCQTRCGVTDNTVGTTVRNGILVTSSLLTPDDITIGENRLDDIATGDVAGANFGIECEAGSNLAVNRNRIRGSATMRRGVQIADAVDQPSLEFTDNDIAGAYEEGVRLVSTQPEIRAWFGNRIDSAGDPVAFPHSGVVHSFDAAESSLVARVRRTLGPWARDDVAASLSSDPLALYGDTTRQSRLSMRAGSITGIVVRSNEARTGGNLTVEATINGAATGLTAQLNSNDTTVKVTTQAAETDSYVAGDEIGATVSTSSNWEPTTADITVELEVVE